MRIFERLRLGENSAIYVHLDPALSVTFGSRCLGRPASSEGLGSADGSKDEVGAQRGKRR